MEKSYLFKTDSTSSGQHGVNDSYRCATEKSLRGETMMEMMEAVDLVLMKAVDLALWFIGIAAIISVCKTRQNR